MDSKNLEDIDMAIEKLSALQCYILPGNGKYCSLSALNFYNSAYRFWREIICEGLMSEQLYDQISSLTSDDFFRHEEVACLYYQEQPIGLVLFDFINLKTHGIFDHSCLKHYPPSILERLKQESHALLMTAGSMCVHPDWRKNKMGPGVSDILFNMITSRLLESPASMSLFFTRDKRGINALAKRFGASSLLKNYFSYNGASEIMAVYRHDARNGSSEPLRDLAENIWQKKINLMDRQHFTMDQFFGAHRHDDEMELAHIN